MLYCHTSRVGILRQYMMLKHDVYSLQKSSALMKLKRSVKPKSMYNLYSLPSLLTLNEIRNPEYKEGDRMVKCSN